MQTSGPSETNTSFNERRLKPCAVRPVLPIQPDPGTHNDKFTFYTFVTITMGATTGLLLGYDNGESLDTMLFISPAFEGGMLMFQLFCCLAGVMGGVVAM